ncbi:hypothetical protein J7T55_003918 [Diaporthe amygdali]|uniref:uncharacterized protein n=1 Tax=Phomopsis amygdali TaxID=1214568 RepID=UPI0022FE68FE|nr:uncharacterized protein J7T55_003918 [Diaporthe amygdali]KAJ0117501.1 hypothetical protein J7T55_003918 [Diaporthe amygdali]
MDEWVGQGPRDQLMLCDVVAGSSPKLLIVPQLAAQARISQNESRGETCLLFRSRNIRYCEMWLRSGVFRRAAPPGASLSLLELNRFDIDRSPFQQFNNTTTDHFATARVNYASSRSPSPLKGQFFGAATTDAFDEAPSTRLSNLESLKPARTTRWNMMKSASIQKFGPRVIQEAD